MSRRRTSLTGPAATPDNHTPGSSACPCPQNTADRARTNHPVGTPGPSRLSHDPPLRGGHRRPLSRSSPPSTGVRRDGHDDVLDDVPQQRRSPLVASARAESARRSMPLASADPRRERRFVRLRRHGSQSCSKVLPRSNVHVWHAFQRHSAELIARKPPATSTDDSPHWASGRSGPRLR